MKPTVKQYVIPRVFMTMQKVSKLPEMALERKTCIPWSKVWLEMGVRVGQGDNENQVRNGQSYLQGMPEVIWVSKGRKWFVKLLQLRGFEYQFQNQEPPENAIRVPLTNKKAIKQKSKSSFQILEEFGFGLARKTALACFKNCLSIYLERSI